MGQEKVLYSLVYCAVFSSLLFQYFTETMLGSQSAVLSRLHLILSVSYVG